MKAVVAAFNQEKALVGAFSVITNLRMELFRALPVTRPLQAWDYIALTGTTEQRVVEWVDHLHHHFTHPPRVEAARCGCKIYYTIIDYM